MRYLVCMVVALMTFAAFHGNSLAKKITRPTERAVFHNNQGVKYLNENNLKLAELEFKTAAELSPEYIEAYNNLGIVSKLKGDLSSAKIYFQRAIELDKNYGGAYSHLSMVYLTEGDIDNAYKYGKLATKYGSTFPVTHFNLALVYLEKSKIDPGKSFDQYAENELKVATELNPNMVEAHLTLARLYKRQGRYELSSIRYRLALENNPNDVKAWNELGEVYKALGDNAKAENAFRKAASISQGGSVSNTPNSEVGTELINRKEYLKGIEELRKAVESNPSSDIAHYKLGSAYLGLGETKLVEGNKTEADAFFDAAIPPLQQALKLNPQQADASYNIGLVYFRLGNLQEAEKNWTTTLSINQNHPRALYNLGTLSNYNKNTKKAVEYLCRFAAVAGQEFASERENALKIVNASGGKCQN